MKNNRLGNEAHDSTEELVKAAETATKQPFIKSAAFKCVTALLTVLLICGVFLTIMNGLLAVSPEERFERAIMKIYGKSVPATAVAVEDYNSNATINEAYKMGDGNYLVKSTGKGGFSGGTVTCWVVIEVKGGAISGVGKVIIDSNVGQSYINYINDKFLTAFTTNYEDGAYFTPAEGFIKTGATMSATAICNAVNGALDFVNAKFGNIKTEGEKLLESIQKVYGETQISVYGTDADGNEKLITAEDETVTSFITTPIINSTVTVSTMYKVRYTDGDKQIEHLLVTSTGKGGYEKGTVTCLTIATVENGAVAKIYKVTITENEKQSFIGKIDWLDKFSGLDINEGLVFTPTGDFLTTGATMSSTAICNAVNGAVDYLKALTLEGGNENE